VGALALLLALPPLASAGASPEPGPSASAAAAGGVPEDWALGACTAIVRLEAARDHVLAMADAAGFEELDRMTTEAVAAATLGDAALTALDAITSDWYPGDRVVASLGDAAFALVDLGVGLQEADPNDAPTVRRALADSLRGLASIEESRLAFASLDPAEMPSCEALPLPSAPPLPELVASPGPSYGTDDDLAAAFPDTIGGVPVIASTIDGAGIEARTDPADLDGQDRLAILRDVTAGLGLTMDDVSVGFAEVDTGDGSPPTITALRIQGAEIATVADRLIGVLTVDYLDPRLDTVEIGGRTYTRLGDGSYDPTGIGEVVVPIGDTLWAVAAREPYLTEIVETLAAATP
jgi:hypothetical protein